MNWYVFQGLQSHVRTKKSWQVNPPPPRDIMTTNIVLYIAVVRLY